MNYNIRVEIDSQTEIQVSIETEETYPIQRLDDLPLDDLATNRVFRDAIKSLSQEEK